MTRRQLPAQYRYYEIPPDSHVLALFAVEWLHLQKPGDAPHFHNLLELGVCHEGRGVLVYGSTELRFQAGTVIVAPANYPHATFADPSVKNTWEYLLIDVEAFLKEAYPEGSDMPWRLAARVNAGALHLPESESPAVKRRMLELLDVCRRREDLHRETQKGLTLALLVEIAKAHKSPPESDMRSRAVASALYRALEHIGVHYAEKIHVGELAELCHLSESHFRRLFTECMHTSPVSYKRLKMSKKQSLIGWCFLIPGALMIAWMSFYPIIRAFLLSFQTGVGASMHFAGGVNYARILDDKVFLETIGNTFLYFVVQVPIMLTLALILAITLNDRKLRFKGLFRTCIFLPCALSLVSYAIIFRSLFAPDGYVNTILIGLGVLDTGYNWLGNIWSAKLVIVLALIWRWTGYNMVFYLAGLQNIEYSIYEAARIDGASSAQQLFKITIPLLKPMILLTAIMSTNGTLQLFDESFNLTKGGPGTSSMTMAHYLYRAAFMNNPNFGYMSAVSFVIVLFVAVLSLIQVKVGDKR